MKKIFFILGMMVLTLSFSCKSAPETVPEEIPREDTIPLTEPSPEEDPVPPAETASVIVPEAEPENDTAQNDLLEPNEPETASMPEYIDEFAEITDFPAEPPMEYPEIIVQEPMPILAKPEEDPLAEPSAEFPAISQHDISPAPEPVTETQVPAEQKPKQEPPAFLRPAEPIEDSTIVRESLPVPVNPIPELPARPVPSLEKNDDIVFSRTVYASVGQLIEIPFRGTGWVFLGEQGSRRGVSYNSRRMDTEGQSFIFLAEQAGTYILKFYKEDYIRDYILNDHVQVIVEEAPESSGTGWFNPPSDRSRVIAEPRWPLEPGSANAAQNVPSQPAPPRTAPEPITPAAVPPPDETGSSIQDEGIVPVSPPLPSGPPAENIPGTSNDASAVTMPENAAPEEYIKKAQEEFNAGQIVQAISILEQFKERYPSGSDEAFWLLGQFYEANSPSRDIRTALSYYYRLTNEYPQSKRFNNAKARIAYLERYFLNIR